MKALVTLLVVPLVLFVSGCVPPTPIAVELETPSDGSSVDSLTPVLAWSCTAVATSYHVQIAEDTNFQTIAVDAASVTSPTYTVPSGNLKHGRTYFWRVSASRTGQTSGWSTPWSFKTSGGGPVAGGISVYATLDGTPWTGTVDFTITGPTTRSGAAVPGNFADLSHGTYTVTYNYGGPAGASLASITPSPTQILTAGSSLAFTLNFHRHATSNINVSATLDGAAWSGATDYTLHGPYSDSHHSVPANFPGVPAGTYTLSYNGGGPAGATLTSIMPAPTQNLGLGGTINFTLNFTRESFGNVIINATLNGAPWSGQVAYNLHGPVGDYHGAVPQTYPNMPSGTYTLSYYGGGPAGATLANITPSPAQTLYKGTTIVFNMNFFSQPQAGTIMINATLDGAPWQVMPGSGSINYTITGPKVDSEQSVPQTLTGMPAGMYTLSYNSGGPIGGALVGITPSPSQTLPPGGTIVFTMNFRAQAKGTVEVNATLNDAPWSGSVNYVVQGPYVQSGYSAPQAFSNAPAGSYSISYSSGGPPSAVFEGVTPPYQMLQAGGNIRFTLRFTFRGVEPQPMPGPIPGPIPGPLK
ncbi:MAG: hypothetical protein FJZ88_00650 [Chloroflexi bacterium]|nr:hypothetical protein [Chloroflexota bacterium]